MSAAPTCGVKLNMVYPIDRYRGQAVEVSGIIFYQG
nr:MAG TPA: hypothetical protein [Caudoviricetes sp.]